jgi:hypothetical protein
MRPDGHTERLAKQGFPVSGKALISITQVELREGWRLAEARDRVPFTRHSRILAQPAKLGRMEAAVRRSHILIVIRLLHTIAWFGFVACILAVPIAGEFGRFRVAAILSGVVLAECLVLAVNRCRCPLTNLAAAYTEERVDNFDIYLPFGWRSTTRSFLDRSLSRSRSSRW